MSVVNCYILWIRNGKGKIYCSLSKYLPDKCALKYSKEMCEWHLVDKKGITLSLKTGRSHPAPSQRQNKVNLLKH